MAREIWLAETVAPRRAIVSRAGDFRVFDPGAEAGPEGVDLAIDGVGLEATRAAACRFRRSRYLGTYTYTMADFRETAAAIFDGRLGALDWVEVRPLSEGARAFEDIAAGRVAAPELVLEP